MDNDCGSSTSSFATIGVHAVSPTSAAVPALLDDPASEWVALQFDDRVFPMMRCNLTSDPNSLFARLFCTDSASLSSLARNSAHPLRPVIFDRSAKFVEPILNYLRSGELVIPGDEKDAGMLRGVYLEAQYFGVTGVIEELQDNPLATTSASQRRAMAVKAAGARPITATRAEIERILMTTSKDQPLRWCGMCFDGVDFSGLNLSHVDLSRSFMNKCKFNWTDLSHAILVDAEFTESDFSNATLTSANCRLSDFRLAKFCAATCIGTDFSQSLLVEADFSQCNLQGANLNTANMSNCVLLYCNLKEANLRNAVLHGVERQGTSLTMGGVIA